MDAIQVTHTVSIRYAYNRVADAVAADIASGTLPIGAALPSERAMVDIHRVSIGTVRRAVRELVSRGLVATLPAKGTYVIATPDQAQPPEA